ncbi:hypothetical protein F511_32647 [Dorcoceras hygrometricum]|uniref:Uncharacterized protein n=1 Tax=Dorcoceras hygrometricum TaxID=472368 RepID=A0A2Z7BCT2_9LAMI|nr:hypothetical protein F511_32647 [Dorcoceras hygrometricum]
MLASPERRPAGGRHTKNRTAAHDAARNVARPARNQRVASVALQQRASAAHRLATGQQASTNSATSRPVFVRRAHGQRAASARNGAVMCSDVSGKTMALIPLFGDPDPPLGQAAEERKTENREAINTKNNLHSTTFIGFTPIRSTTRSETPSSGCTRSPDEISTNGFSTSSWPKTNFPAKTAAAAAAHGSGGGGGVIERGEGREAAVCY